MWLYVFCLLFRSYLRLRYLIKVFTVYLSKHHPFQHAISHRAFMIHKYTYHRCEKNVAQDPFYYKITLFFFLEHRQSVESWYRWNNILLVYYVFFFTVYLSKHHPSQHAIASCIHDTFCMYKYTYHRCEKKNVAQDSFYYTKTYKLCLIIKFKVL